MKQLILLLIAAFLLAGAFGDAKRSLGRGSSSRSSSSSSSSRRVSHATSRPVSHVTSRPVSHVTSRPATNYGSNSHADAAKMSYPNYNSQPNRVATGNNPQASNIGWNVNNQNKPAGPPPAYSAHNPVGGARPNINEKPPSYTGTNNSPIRAQTQRPIQSSYPKQALPVNTYPHNSNVPSNAKYYPVGSAPNVGYHPAGTIGGGYHPPAGGPTYYPAGHAPPVGYHPGGFGGGAGYHPQSPPVYAPPGVQPGYYPAGAFPQQKTNSGPGIGTGLIVGALGGAVLGHALTPTHNNYGGSGGGYGAGGHSDSDRVIIINNTPGQPATVTTQDGHQPVIVNNAPAQAPPGAPVQPDAPVPLAPFQPGSTQSVNPPVGDQIPSAAGVSPPLVHSPNSAAPSSGQTYPDGTVPLAPLVDNNSTATEAPKSGGVMCYPVLVNITSETDPTNITTVEQIACYEVPAGFDPNAPTQQQPDQSSSTGSTISQKPDLMQMPGEQITQRTSTATLAETSQIKQNGAIGQHSPLSTITSTIIAIMIAYCLQ